MINVKASHHELLTQKLKDAIWEVIVKSPDDSWSQKEGLEALRRLRKLMKKK